MEKDKEQKNRKIKQVYISPRGIEESVDITDDRSKIITPQEGLSQNDIENFRRYAKEAREDLNNAPTWSEADMRENLSSKRDNQRISGLGNRPDSVDNAKHLKEEARHKREEKDAKRRNAKIIALIAAVIFSMIFAAGMGTALALWDTGKSVADLNNAIFNRNIVTLAANTKSSALNTKKDNVKDDNTQKADKLKQSDVKNEVVKTKPEEDKNTDETIEKKASDSVQSGTKDKSKPGSLDMTKDATLDLQDSKELSEVNSIVKAGSDDIIETSAYIDPMESYPLEFTEVNEDYFKDALFIGDSRLHGFGLWSGVDATFYTSVGFQLYKYETTKVVQTENGKLPILDAMPDDSFTKVYIKVGLNEMGWANEERFEKLYAELIDKIRQKEPRAIIYIHGILPVTASKVAEGTPHNNVNIDKRNEALKKFAVEQKAYFVDVGEAYKGADGCLPANMASDGIHLKAQYMKDWVKYLKEHAIVLK